MIEHDSRDWTLDKVSCRKRTRNHTLPPTNKPPVLDIGIFLKQLNTPATTLA